MQWMFDGATDFNQDLSKWDVSRVINMEGMFNYAKSFNQDLSKWDVSRVTDMDSMFKGADSFQQTLCGAAWVNSKATKIDMFDMSPGSISKTVCETPTSSRSDTGETTAPIPTAFSPQSWDELKRALNTCL